MFRSPTASLALAALLAAAAPAQVADEAAADVAARDALPRAEIRTITGEVRTIAGLGGATGGETRAITGQVVSLAAVERGLAGLSTRMVDGRLEVSLPGDVLFDFDKAAIRASAIPTLERVRAAAAQTGTRPVRVEGHTDAVGTPAYNQRLSEARAQAVARWLTDAGVERERVDSAGFGATRPVAPNRRPDGRDDPAGRQRNRRVTVLL